AECINNERGTSLPDRPNSAYIGTMTVSNAPKGPARLLARGAACLLAILILLGPVYGQGTGDPAAPSKSSASHRKKTTSTASSGKRGSTSSTAARRKARHRGTKAQRLARTARIKKAFVASTELR